MFNPFVNVFYVFYKYVHWVKEQYDVRKTKLIISWWISQVFCYILQCVGMSQNWAHMEKSVCHHPGE